MTVLDLMCLLDEHDEFAPTPYAVYDCNGVEHDTRFCYDKTVVDIQVKKGTVIVRI